MSSGPCSSASLRDGWYSRTCSSSSDSDSLSGAYLKEGIARLYNTHLPQPVISCTVLRIPGNVEREWEPESESTVYCAMLWADLNAGRLVI